MPHVLAGLQGIQELVVEEDPEHEGEEHSALELTKPGRLSEAAYDEFVLDIVNFLDYIGEPMQRERQALGIRVIGFLLVLLLIASMLKREIWRDVE
jgi:ubiquinol-cytochrome c reductase cytochrome c1 subunit